MSTLEEILQWCEDNDKTFEEAILHFGVPAERDLKDSVPVPPYKLTILPKAQAYMQERFSREEIAEAVAEALKFMADDGADLRDDGWITVLQLEPMEKTTTTVLGVSPLSTTDDGVLFVGVSLMEFQQIGEMAGKAIMAPRSVE